MEAERQCVAGRPHRAQLRNSVTDPDGDKANLTFEVWTVDSAGKPKAKVKLTGQNADPANQGTVSAEYGVIVSKMVASGSKATVTVPHGNLKPATTYAFRTSAYDGSLYETDWSPYATFKTRGRQVDITLPAPKKDATDPAFDTSWQPVPGWGSVQTRDAEGEQHCEATAHGDRLCIAWEPATKEDLQAARESRAIDTLHGPEEPMPAFPDDLRTLADEALARVISEEAGPASNWVDSEDWKQWRADLDRLRTVLAPPPSSIPLFDIGQ
ncbi:hypothetical protein [Streptomyces sp. NPDC052012]|uniref:hypothetical protein n=1 Tax=Streptomyces sp. NPDC052012 TaxID=3155051 RepID=UPI00344CA73A